MTQLVNKHWSDKEQWRDLLEMSLAIVLALVMGTAFLSIVGLFSEGVAKLLTLPTVFAVYLCIKYRRGIQSYFKEHLSLDKKKATAVELGTGLLLLAKGSEESDTSSLAALPAEADRRRIRNEFLYLRAFVVDFAVSMKLGDSREKKAVLDVYYAHLREMTKGTGLFPEIAERLDIYAEAVNTPHQNGPAWTVGLAFAKLCGQEKDLNLVTRGGIQFGTTFKAVSDFVNSFRIVCD